MLFKEAVQQLKSAGLHVRLMGEDLIVGGGYVDRSSHINMVRDGFLIQTKENKFETFIEKIHPNPKERISLSTLDEAVALVIKEVLPGKDIEPTPKPPGPAYY